MRRAVLRLLQLRQPSGCDVAATAGVAAAAPLRVGTLLLSALAGDSADQLGRRHFASQNGSTSNGVGLFGLPELRQPSDFKLMMQDARSRCVGAAPA
jgi:hypothetical protein